MCVSFVTDIMKLNGRSNQKHTLTRHFPTNIFILPQESNVVDAVIPILIPEIDHAVMSASFPFVYTQLKVCTDTHTQLSAHRWQLMEMCETWENAFSNTKLGWCYWRHHQSGEARAGKHLHICEHTCVLLNIPDCTLHWGVLGDSSLCNMVFPRRFTPIITTETILTILQLALAWV